MSLFYSAGLGESAIPDSVLAQFNAQELSGFSDQDAVASWSDETGTYTLDQGPGGTYIGSGINGYPSVEFDSEYLYTTGANLSQPLTLIIVAEIQTVSNLTVFGGGSTSDAYLYYWNDASEWRVFGGDTVLRGSGDTAVLLQTAVLDGASSELREDGTQTDSGDTGANGLADLVAASRTTGGNTLGHIQIGFAEIHDGLPSNGLSTREQEVADMWNITL